MSNRNFQHLIIEFDATQCHVDCDEPDRYVHVHTGRLLLAALEDAEEVADDQLKPIGTFKLFYVDLESAVYDGDDPRQVLDTHAQLEDAAGQLYRFRQGGEPSFKAAVCRAAAIDGEFWRPNLLLLDRLEIDSPHRGMGYGLAALTEIIRSKRQGVGLVAMKPFPLQFECKLSGSTGDATRQSPMQTEFKAAERKLRAYYRKLGFIKLPGSSPYMVLAGDAVLPMLSALE